MAIKSLYKESKYHNKKITFNGEVFDSHKEFNRYQELRILERAGKISNLHRQVRFNLIPVQRDERGVVIERACDYIADFVYFDVEKSETVVEDVKVMKTKTKDYIIKRKLLLYKHGYRIREV